MTQAHNLVGSIAKSYAKINNPNLSNIYCLSKAELRKQIECMDMEIQMLKKRIKELEPKLF